MSYVKCEITAYSVNWTISGVASSNQQKWWFKHKAMEDNREIDETHNHPNAECINKIK